MTTPSGLGDFQPILYNPDLEHLARRVMPSERQSHRLQPYARSSSMSDTTLYSEGSSMASGSFVSSDTGKNKARKKLSLSDLPPNDRPAVKWARKRLVMDLFTSILWSQLETESDRDIYLREIISQANVLFGTNLQFSKDLTGLITQSVTQFRSGLIEVVDRFLDEFLIRPPGVMSKEHRVAYMINRRIALLDASEENRWQYFLHGRELVQISGSDSEKLLVFGNDTLQKILLLHMYASNYTPLRDERFLAELSTTTSHMFSHVAVGAECGIDKVVEEESSGRSVRFLGERYAPRQASYFDAIEEAFKKQIHKDTLPARFLDLHNRGIQALRAKSGLLPPEKLIYVPDTMEQLVRPHQAGAAGSSMFSQSSSAGAVPQMPVQDLEARPYPQYLTGPVFERYEPEPDDEDNTNSVTSWPGGYSFY